ncbi:MAG: hypothetical protein CL504_09510, partial [Actinobacteria bacterium]|nr:hypothetical protein [Actinomycetota bacterium]
DGTLGVIQVDDQKFYSVERPWMDNAPNVSCIPEGEYKVSWRLSPRFGETWHIQDVPDRTHILIHAANFPYDVEGCIGLGMGVMDQRVGVKSSRRAVQSFDELTRSEEEWLLKVEFAHLAGL